MTFTQNLEKYSIEVKNTFITTLNVGIKLRRTKSVPFNFLHYNIIDDDIIDDDTPLTIIDLNSELNIIDPDTTLNRISSANLSDISHDKLSDISHDKLSDTISHDKLSDISHEKLSDTISHDKLSDISHEKLSDTMSNSCSSEIETSIDTVTKAHKFTKPILSKTQIKKLNQTKVNETSKKKTKTKQITLNEKINLIIDKFPLLIDSYKLFKMDESLQVEDPTKTLFIDEMTENYGNNFEFLTNKIINEITTDIKFYFERCKNLDDLEYIIELFRHFKYYLLKQKYNKNYTLISLATNKILFNISIKENYGKIRFKNIDIEVINITKKIPLKMFLNQAKKNIDDLKNDLKEIIELISFLHENDINKSIYDNYINFIECSIELWNHRLQFIKKNI